MTVKEYFVKRSLIVGIDYADSMIEDFLTLEDIDPEGDVIDRKDLDIIFLNLVKNLLLRPKSISEGGYSITYDIEGLKRWYAMEARRLGLDDEMSDLGVVKDSSSLW